MDTLEETATAVACVAFNILLVLAYGHVYEDSLLIWIIEVGSLVTLALRTLNVAGCQIEELVAMIGEDRAPRAQMEIRRNTIPDVVSTAAGVIALLVLGHNSEHATLIWIIEALSLVVLAFWTFKVAYCKMRELAITIWKDSGYITGSAHTISSSFTSTQDAAATINTRAQPTSLRDRTPRAGMEALRRIITTATLVAVGIFLLLFLENTDEHPTLIWLVEIVASVAFCAAEVNYAYSMMRELIIDIWKKLGYTATAPPTTTH